MLRVTNRMLYNNTLVNTFRQNEDMLKTQEQLASGKRVNKPSDDPLAIGEIITYKARINRNDQFVSMGEKATLHLNTADAVVGSTTELASRAKELALSQVGGAASAETRAITAREIAQLLDQAIAIGNTQIGSDYIFGGRKTGSEVIDSSGLYQGDSTELSTEINQNTMVNMSVLASDFLTADLNPDITSATPVTALNNGNGIAAGTFTITDRAGGTGSVTVGSGDTVASVIASINGSGANVTASISSDGRGIRIIDNTAVSAVTGPFVIAESGSSTATDLGIVGSRDVQVVLGSDLDPDITSSTLLSSLLGGAGLTPTDISIVNGSASATVTLSSATTVGDVLTAINGSGTNSTAAINGSGTGFSLTSATSGTVAFAKDIGSGTTAELFGIGGGRNLIGTLQRLQLALERGDATGISIAIDQLTESIDSTTAIRGTIGARVNRVTSTGEQVDQSTYDNRVMLSMVEDADMAAAATNLALLQSSYQATIQSAARIIQPTLMDFLR